jgi:hypothetical protein
MTTERDPGERPELHSAGQAMDRPATASQTGRTYSLSFHCVACLDFLGQKRLLRPSRMSPAMRARPMRISSSRWRNRLSRRAFENCQWVRPTIPRSF